MLHVPKRRKQAPSASKANGRRINKSQWIRDQPANTPAKEILSKAKAAGITLSLAQIYTARSTAKKRARAGASRPAGRGSVTRLPAIATKEISDLRHEFVRITMRIGTDEAQRLLDRIIDVETSTRGFA